MAQRLAGGDALLRIVDEDAAQQVQELAVEGVGLRDHFLELLHAAHEFPRLARRVRLRVVELIVLEEPRRAVLIGALGCALHFFDQTPVDRRARYRLRFLVSFMQRVWVVGFLEPHLHHGEMLTAVVSLE